MFLVERLKQEPCAFNESEWQWMTRAMTKICVRVDSEEELLDVIAKARAAGLTVHAVTDAGRTEFRGVPTLTCCSIGPNDADEIDVITGHLKLL